MELTLFAAQRFHMMHPHVQFHEYILYGLGVMAKQGYSHGIKSSGNYLKKNEQEMSFFFESHGI